MRDFDLADDGFGFLSRLFTALDLLPSMAILAVVRSSISR
jgi:hypothetical protein